MFKRPHSAEDIHAISSSSLSMDAIASEDTLASQNSTNAQSERTNNNLSLFGASPSSMRNQEKQQHSQGRRMPPPSYQVQATSPSQQMMHNLPKIATTPMHTSTSAYMTSLSPFYNQSSGMYLPQYNYSG